jgi:hypothetical protein
MTGAEAFVHVFGNLYLVATPLQEGKSRSMIEDSFTEETRSVILNGKTFDPQNDFDTLTHYGKHTFSQYIEKHSSMIDFAGFRGILTRLDRVIAAHRDAVAVAPGDPPPHSAESVWSR